MQFNETLVRLRKEHGYTQEQLAEQVGVSRQAVARWEAGETAPDVYVLQMLCGIFGVSADVLLNGSKENGEPAAVEFPEEKIPEPKKESSTSQLKVKLAFAAAVMAIAAVTVTANIGIAKLSEAKSSASGMIGSDKAAPPPLSSLSYSRTEFWTAEEYEKWAEERLEDYREKLESGEKLLWYTESGDEEYRALTEFDLESMKKSMDDVLEAIKNGDLYTKDDVISWTGPDGEKYSVIAADMQIVSGVEDSYAAGSEDWDVFLTYDSGVATTYATSGETSEAGGMTLAERFAQYAEFGLKYEEKEGLRRLYYNGEPVAKFVDISPDGGIFVFAPDGGGTVRVQTEYDEEGKLVGLGK